jgi:hypothetical protein
MDTAPGLITDFDGHHLGLITVSGLDYDRHYPGLVTDFDGHRLGLITDYDGLSPMTNHRSPTFKE